MHYVATEVSMPGNSLADVLASDGTNLIEYEVKVSMSDLRGDKEKPKHLIYDPTPITWDGAVGTKRTLKLEIKADSEASWDKDRVYLYINGNKKSWPYWKTVEAGKEYVESHYASVKGGPNMMYYVIPKDMWENKKEKVEAALSDVYGIITFTDESYFNLTLQRKAKKLHKNEVSPAKLRTMAARMSSEIAALTQAHYKYILNMTTLGKQVQERFNVGEDNEEKED
jgi:hypothetical protein